MRCESCKVDYESDAKYCRTCGKLLNITPQHPAEELSAEHSVPAEAVKSNSTSVIGVDFSNPPSPKQVEPLRQEGNSKTAKNRRLRRRWQAALWPATAVALQLAIAVTTITYVRRYTLQPQAPASIAEATALFTTEQAVKELKQELADDTRAKEELAEKIAEQKNEIAEQQQFIKKLDRESADKQRKLQRLEGELAGAKAELNGVRTEIASAESRRDELNAQVARVRRALGASQRAVAKLAPKVAEVARLDRRLKVLRTMASERELVVRNLQRRIDLMTNANHASRNRRRARR